MTSMFPGQGNPDKQPGDRPGPVDYNRPLTPAEEADPQRAPGCLRAAYWVLVGAAIVLLASGLVGLFGTAHLGAPPDPAVAEYLRRNRSFVSYSNIACAIAIALCAAHLFGGSRWPRRVITVASALSLFVNIAAMALGIGGLALLIIPLALMVALALLFRPAVGRYLKANEDLRRADPRAG